MLLTVCGFLIIQTGIKAVRVFKVRLHYK